MLFQSRDSDVKGLGITSRKQFKLLPYKGGCGPRDLLDPRKPKFNLFQLLQIWILPRIHPGNSRDVSSPGGRIYEMSIGLTT